LGYCFAGSPTEPDGDYARQMHLDLSDADRKLFEERAAILEYDADWPRPIAESEATRHVCRLLWERGAFRLGSWDGAADIRCQAPGFTST